MAVRPVRTAFADGDADVHGIDHRKAPMTSQPPPGDYPPPPPAGGHPPAPPAEGYGASPVATGAPWPSAAAIPVLPKEAYTPWIKRVAAAVIDSVPTLLLTAIAIAVLFALQKVETVCITETEFDLGEFCATGNNGPSTAAWIIFAVCILISLVYSIWNYFYRQGTTGSTVGKSIMNFKVVSEKTGQPIGFLLAFVRQLAHAVDNAILGIGYLFPLWDAKRQTLADKIMSTVCLPVDVPSLPSGSSPTL